jgi:ELWxxDGT repeat protein
LEIFMASRFLGLLLAAAFVVLPAALPAAPYLVKDLNTSTEQAGRVIPADRGTGQGVTYFAAGDPAHGVELWRSDGTPGGTGRLTDICAGRCDALPSYQPSAITVRAGRVYFRANDGFSGDELWVSDGTPGSERRVRDVCSGPCSAVPSLVEEVGGRLLFVSHLPAEPERFELWRTDGTRVGTVRVKTLCAASATDCAVSSGLLPIGGRALFLVNLQATKPEEMELWVTDGTTAGTRSLRELGSAITLRAFNASVLPGDGFAWVWASDGLWRTDGTAAGTFRLKRTGELTADAATGAYLYRDVLWHGLYFGFMSQGEMIRSDGTPEGTFRVVTLSSDTDSHIVRSFALLDSELLLQVDDSSGNSVLWGTRGTADTTGPRFELGSGGTASLASLSGDRALFLWSSFEDSGKARLSVTDGTAAGTRQLAVAAGGLTQEAESLFPTGDGRAFFFGAPTPNDLWITDGTEAGTQRVRSFWGTPGSSGPLEQAALGEKLVFSALEFRQPFVSDGTAAGTGLLSEEAFFAFSFFRFGDRLLFSASKSGRNHTVWATDGTPAGTIEVTKSTELSRPALLGGQILFNGFSLETGDELWKTDSLTRTFDLVKDINPFSFDYEHGVSHLCLAESSLPVPAGVIGGRLLFAADDGRSGRELWASDGTPAGTVLLKDIHPGRTLDFPRPCWVGSFGPHRHDTGLSSDPQGFVLLGSVVLFSADDGVRGRELWVSNGTFPGTRRLADLVPGPRGSAPHDLVRLQKRVYFLAGNPSGPGGPGQGESLWSTDGTARGTTRVLDLTLDGQPSWGRSLTVAAGRLFFTVYNETTGAELWTSAGLLTDLNPGPGNAAPQSLTSIGGTLLFAAADGLTGLEPWRTDGTAAGTARVADIAPGRDASSPGPFTAIQNLVITGADDGVHGREPWAIPRAEIVQPPR